MVRLSCDCFILLTDVVLKDTVKVRHTFRISLTYVVQYRIYDAERVFTSRQCDILDRDPLKFFVSHRHYPIPQNPISSLLNMNKTLWEIIVTSWHYINQPLLKQICVFQFVGYWFPCRDIKRNASLLWEKLSVGNIYIKYHQNTKKLIWDTELILDQPTIWHYFWFYSCNLILN